MGPGFVCRRPDNAVSEVVVRTRHLSGEFYFGYEAKSMRPFNWYGATNRPGVNVDLQVLPKRWALPPFLKL